MSNGVNKVIIVGNLGRDPELRYSQSGTAVCNMGIAVGERKKDAAGNWRDHTEWVNVVFFGKTAENVGQFLSKGRQVYVEGRLQTQKYKDRDGNERWKTEVIAHNVVFLGTKGKGGGSGGGGQREDHSDGPAPDADAGFYDDDLPFIFEPLHGSAE